MDGKNRSAGNVGLAKGQVRRKRAQTCQARQELNEDRISYSVHYPPCHHPIPDLTSTRRPAKDMSGKSTSSSGDAIQVGSMSLEALTAGVDLEPLADFLAMPLGECVVVGVQGEPLLTMHSSSCNHPLTERASTPLSRLAGVRAGQGHGPSAENRAPRREKARFCRRWVASAAREVSE